MSTIRARGMKLKVKANGDLETELGSIENPLKDVQIRGIDKGELFARLWAEDQHNKLDARRVRIILLNMLNLDVANVMAAMREEVK